MTYSQQIDHALQRSQSPFDALDVLRWLREGKAKLYVSGGLHASLRFYGTDKAEVGHMAGTWSAHDAQWIIDRARAECKRRGIPDLTINGRKGWRRFLRMKGVL